MAKQFDSDPIAVGDKLFDIADERWVTVRQLYSDRFMVSVAGSNASRTYSYKGVAARRSGRTLYWQDPRLIIPRKSPAYWQAQKKLVTSVIGSMSEHLPGIELNEIELAQSTEDISFEQARRAELGQEIPADQTAPKVDPEAQARFEQYTANLREQVASEPAPTMRVVTR